MGSVFGAGDGRKNPPATPFGYHSQTVPNPRTFQMERFRVLELMMLFPFRPREMMSIPEEYSTYTAPMLWGPFHQQSEKHRAKACYQCGRHFAEYPEEDSFFEEMGHEYFKHHNFRKHRFHQMTYVYVLYHHAGYDIHNRVVRMDILDAMGDGTSSSSRMGFKALENNPNFGALRKMYNDELIRRMGHDPEAIGKAVFDRVLDMAIPEHTGNGEIMKTDQGKREALATLAYMSLPDVHTAIQAGDLSQKRIRLEEGDKVLEIPVGYVQPSLPSDSEAING